MAELIGVERPITEASLENGEIEVEPQEQDRLGLPEYSGDLMLEAGGEHLPVRWESDRHRLTGPALADHLRRAGRIGGRIRLARSGTPISPAGDAGTNAASDVWPAAQPDLEALELLVLAPDSEPGPAAEHAVHRIGSDPISAIPHQPTGTREECAACAGDAELVSCPVCARPVCTDCRSEGSLCLECAFPERVPELDTDHERSWRLGGGSAVLVGSRHAILVDAAGLRTRLIPDADFYHEAKSRLRTLADRLQLSPSAGLTRTGRAADAADLVAGAVWSRVSEQVWWRPGPRIDDVDPDCVDLLPELPRPLVGPGQEQAESYTGIADLLSELRRREAPPVPDAVTAVPLTIAGRIDVEDGQFCYRETWREPGVEAMDAVLDRRPLVTGYHPSPSFARAVATARLGPVEVRVTRVHRSYLVELSDGGHAASVFVPGVPGATLAAEQHLAELVIEAQLGLNQVLVRHPWPGVSEEDVRYSPPASGVQVTRQGTVVWAVLNAAAGEPLIEAVGVPTRPADPLPSLPVLRRDDLLPTLARVHGALDPVAIAPLLMVDEHWSAGSASAARKYLITPATPWDERLSEGRSLVAPGTTALARLDDGRLAGTAVAVDDRGHLYDPASTSECPLCGNRFGTCCDGGAGLAGCPTCDRPACGDCRSAANPGVQPSTCTRCGDVACTDCGRELPLQACAGCRRAVCAQCRPTGGLCQDCENPSRAYDLDTDDEIGWRLGGTSRLLVGPRHAVQIHGAETTYGSDQRIDLVPDADLDDPIRSRVRALAARLGLGPSAGVVLAGSEGDPAPLIEGALWSDVQVSHWWTTTSGPGGDLDPGLVSLLPKLTGPHVVSEAAIGLDRLLDGLREQDPPPAPAALAAVPLTVTRRVDLEDGRFRYREYWQDGAGEPVEARHDVQDLVPNPSEPTDFARPVADAQVGPVTIRVVRVHRSYLIQFSDGEQHQMAFLPGLPGATQAGEEHLAQVLAEAGLSPDHALVRHPGDDIRAEDLTFSRPAADTEVTRDVNVVWVVLESTEGAPMTEPVGELAVATALVSGRVLQAGALLGQLAGLHPQPRPIGIAPALAIREHWRSEHGSTTRRYLVSPSVIRISEKIEGRMVAPGEPVLARFDDGSLVRADDDPGHPRPVSVDSQGHLFDPAHAIACPVCGEPHGDCCSHSVGIASCSTCARQACGDCRNAAHPEIVNGICGRCGDSACNACGRDLSLADCPGCARPICSTCRTTGPFCLDCENPTRAADLDTTFEIGWRLGGTSTLLVGQRHAVVTHPGQGQVDVIPETQDPDRSRVRALAGRLHLPPGVGLELFSPQGDSAELTRGALWSSVVESAWWGQTSEGDGSLDPAALALLPDLTHAHDISHSPDPATTLDPAESADSHLNHTAGTDHPADFAYPPDPAHAPHHHQATYLTASPDTAHQPSSTVQSELDSGLAALLTTLRQQVAPPTEPSLAAMPFTIVRRLDLEDGHLVYREFWRDGDAEPVEAATDRRILRTGAQVVPAGHRPLAQTRVGPLAVAISGLHTSYVITIRDQDGDETASIFLPGVEGATLATEQDQARTVAGAGLPANRVLTDVPKSLSRNERRYAVAAPGTAIHRNENTVQAMVYLDPPDGEPPVDPQLETFAELDVPLIPVALADCILIEEDWRSAHGRAHREYLIAPGLPVDDTLGAGRTLLRPDEPVYPVLDDGSAGDCAISVDRRGHLHGADRAETCPVCQEVYGPCCGVDGLIRDCQTCERPACGRCRTDRRRSIAATRCERCEDFSCTDCGRDLPLSDCDLCDRAVCRSSLVDGLCETCSHLEPATDEDRAALPGELLATGLTVLIGHDPGGSIALLSGGHRQELARICDDTVHAWWTSSADSAELLRIRLTAAQLAGQGDVEISYLTEPAPPPIPIAQVLDESAATELLWSVHRNGERVAGQSPTGVPTTPLPEHLLAPLLQRLESETPAPRVPRPAPAETAERIRQLLEPETGTVPLASPIVTALDFGMEAREHLEALTPDGLLRRTVVGASVADTLVRWKGFGTGVGPGNKAVGGAWDWVGAEWTPRPEILAVGESGAYSAAVAAVGRHLMLGVRKLGMRSRWFSLVEQPGDLLEALLGTTLLNRETLLSVRNFSATSSIRGPQIRDAELIQRRSELDWTNLSLDFDETEHNATGLALAEHAAGGIPRSPLSSGALPEDLSAALVAKFGNRHVDRVRADIGLQVQEEWRLAGGAVIPIRYVIPAGEQTGYVPDAFDGQPTHALQACAAPHLVAQILTCTYCDTPSCGLCRYPARSCALCGVSVCTRCGPDAEGRCAACVGLRPVSLLRRRRLDLPRGATAWQGSDDRAEVTAVLAGESLTVTRRQGTDRTSMTVEGPHVATLTALLKR